MLIIKWITDALLMLVIMFVCFWVKLGSYSVEAAEYLGNGGLTKSRLAIYNKFVLLGTFTEEVLSRLLH